MLALSQLTPIAQGHVRNIYAHPDDAGRLVKVLRADALTERWTSAPWYRRLARTGPYAVFVREFKEYVASRRYGGGDASPLAAVSGLVDTDLGLGLVVDKVRGPDGGLAPTLSAWAAREGVEGQVRDALDRFLGAMLSHNVIAGDLHAWNVVYGSDAHGGPRLVMIDGFGEKNWIPHCSMSRRHNARRTRGKFARMVARLERETDAG